MGIHEATLIENYPPSISASEITAVANALQSGWVSYAGKYVTEFESSVSQVLGFEFAVAVASGTCALQLAFEELGESGAEVIMPALTFAAPASVAVRTGMYPVFVDLDESNWQLDPKAVRNFIESKCTVSTAGVRNKATGRSVSTICIVHLWGALADLKSLLEVAEEFRLHVIQDAAQCLGAKWASLPFGRFRANQRKTLVATSFNANKIITTGSGGAVLGNDPDSMERIRHIASTAKRAGQQFIHDAFGLNYRMSNLNAALGYAQLMRLDAFIASKRAIQKQYDLALMDYPFVGLVRATPLTGVEPNYWSYCYTLDRDALPVIDRLQKRRIQARPVWVPLPDLQPYSAFECANELSVARHVARHGLMLPAGAQMSSTDIDRIAQALVEETA
jgi:perosamine synthetase